MDVIDVQSLTPADARGLLNNSEWVYASGNHIVYDDVNLGVRTLCGLYVDCTREFKSNHAYCPECTAVKVELLHKVLQGGNR